MPRLHLQTINRHASNGILMQATPDIGNSRNADYVLNAPRMDYEIDFAAAGTYTVQMRGRSQPSPDDGASDTVHVGLNGQATPA